MGIEDLRGALEPAVRRVLHFYWRFSRGLTLGVRAVVVDGQGRVFLVRHSYVPGWHLPGGGVEPGETLMTALARELAEEGNIGLAETPLLHGVFYNSRASRRDHVAVFIVRAFHQDAPPQPNHEVVEHGFFHPDRLPSEATPATRRRIAEVFHGAPIAERW
jgi:8-oxo-dGTP pyrophosphatase MutT (NUDIX family)